MRGVASVTASLLVTLRALGLVGDPGLERFAMDANRLVVATFDVAEEHGVPSEAIGEAVERVPLTHRGLRLEGAQ